MSHPATKLRNYIITHHQLTSPFAAHAGSACHVYSSPGKTFRGLCTTADTYVTIYKKLEIRNDASEPTGGIDPQCNPQSRQSVTPKGETERLRRARRGRDDEGIMHPLCCGF